MDVEDHYLDTADGALRTAGVVARIRIGSARPVLTLKGLAQRREGIVHGRLELEGAVSCGDGPPRDPDAWTLSDPGAWPKSDARDRLLQLAGDRPLVTVARIRQRRLQRDIAFRGSRVELSLDDIVVGDDHRWLELEAELRDGSEAELEALGSELLARGGFAPAVASKLERALALAGVVFTER